jgi:radical SAM protein with 4Fe4S-binding SPASM domain
MREQYIKLTDKVIFKTRYNQWYLIDTEKNGEERFLIEGDSENVLRFLFGGRSIKETAYNFKISCKELYDFLSTLVQNDIIEFSDLPVNSIGKCYNTEPPLDSLNSLITNACNLHCAHCYLNSGKAMKDELNGKLWIDVLKQASQLGVFQLNIFANAFATVQISTDDVIAEKHDAFRGCEGCFKKAVRTIEKLVNYGIETNVGFLINSRNLSALDGIVELCEQIGVTALNVGFVNPIGRAKTNRLAYPINSQSLQKNKLLDRMYRKFCKLTERDTKLKILLPFSFRLDGNASLRNKHYICNGDKNQFVSIMADGTVMPCDLLPMDIFGCNNVKNQPLVTIWTSEEMRAFKLMNPQRLPKCSCCLYSQICEGPCVARAFQTENSLESPDWIKCLITQKIAAEREKNNFKA